MLRGEHFELMKDGALLANAGHFDVEIDLAALEALSSGRRRLRPGLDEWTQPDGRRLGPAGLPRALFLPVCGGSQRSRLRARRIKGNIINTASAPAASFPVEQPQLHSTCSTS